MSVVNFVKFIGQKIGPDNGPPPAAALKKILDSYQLGTDRVRITVDGDKVILKGTIATRIALEKTVLAVGNIFGIALVDTTRLKIFQENCTSEITHNGHLVYYTVKKNDDLWKIAEKVYGKGYGIKNILIFDANKPMLTSPSKIYPGQILRIPPLQE